MKIKKLLLLLLIALMVVSFIGCKGGGGTDKTQSQQIHLHRRIHLNQQQHQLQHQNQLGSDEVWMLYCIVLLLKVRI